MARPAHHAVARYSVQFAPGPMMLKVEASSCYNYIEVKGFGRDERGAAGPAESSGKIQVGDLLVGYNDTMFRGVSFDEAMGMIRDAGRPLTLHFVREQGAQPLLRPSATRAPTHPAHRARQECPVAGSWWPRMRMAAAASCTRRRAPWSATSRARPCPRCPPRSGCRVRARRTTRSHRGASAKRTRAPACPPSSHISSAWTIPACSVLRCSRRRRRPGSHRCARARHRRRATKGSRPSSPGPAAPLAAPPPRTGARVAVAPGHPRPPQATASLYTRLQLSVFRRRWVCLCGGGRRSAAVDHARLVRTPQAARPALRRPPRRPSPAGAGAVSGQSRSSDGRGQRQGHRRRCSGWSGADGRGHGGGAGGVWDASGQETGRQVRGRDRRRRWQWRWRRWRRR